MGTQIGLIAAMLQEGGDEDTPLQKKLGGLGKWLGLAALVICAMVFLVGIIKGQTVLTMFLTAVSLAIAAVPEGLPAIVTICLALGMQEMVQRHALIRKLPAVETLGSATAICTDKTGTLTQNRMTVTDIWAGGSLPADEGRRASCCRWPCWQATRGWSLRRRRRRRPARRAVAEYAGD